MNHSIKASRLKPIREFREWAAKVVDQMIARELARYVHELRDAGVPADQIRRAEAEARAQLQRNTK